MEENVKLANEIATVLGLKVRPYTGSRYRGSAGYVQYVDGFWQVDIIGPLFKTYDLDGELSVIGVMYTVIVNMREQKIFGYNTPHFVRQALERNFPRFAYQWEQTPHGAHGPRGVNVRKTPV